MAIQSFSMCRCHPYWSFLLVTPELGSLLLLGCPHIMKQKLHATVRTEHTCLSCLPCSKGTALCLGLCSQMCPPTHTQGGTEGILSVEAWAVLAESFPGESSGSNDGNDVQCLLSGVSGWGKPFCGVIWAMFRLPLILLLQGTGHFSEFPSILL